MPVIGAVDLREAAERMADDLPSSTRSPPRWSIAYDPEQREQLWKARKALYPRCIASILARSRSISSTMWWSRAERISELIRYLEEFFGGQRVPVAIFGHIGNGNAHIVPLLDVNDKRDFGKMVQGYHEIHQHGAGPV